MVTEDKELYQQFPLGRFKLIDLTIMDDDEILKHGKINNNDLLIPRKMKNVKN